MTEKRKETPDFSRPYKGDAWNDFPAVKPPLHEPMQVEGVTPFGGAFRACASYAGGYVWDFSPFKGGVIVQRFRRWNE